MANELSVSGSGAIRGSFLSATERIKAEIHRGQTSMSDDFVKRALISAMEHYRWHRFWFNEGTWNMVTEADRLEYGMETTRGAGDGIPVDLLEIDDMHVFSDPSGENENEYTHTMSRRPLPEIRSLVDSATSRNKPYMYGWHAETLLIYPGPDDEYRIRIDGLKDLDVPRYQYVAGQWVYSDQDGAILADDYVNPWLVYAEELIRARAKADLYANVLFEDSRAATSRGIEQDAYSNLTRATSKRLSVGRIRPYFGGGTWDG